MGRGFIFIFGKVHLAVPLSFYDNSDYVRHVAEQIGTNVEQSRTDHLRFFQCVVRFFGACGLANFRELVGRRGSRAGQEGAGGGRGGRVGPETVAEPTQNRARRSATFFCSVLEHV